MQGIGTGVIRHAFEALAADGLILARRGQTPIVIGTAVPGFPAPGSGLVPVTIADWPGAARTSATR